MDLLLIPPHLILNQIIDFSVVVVEEVGAHLLWLLKVISANLIQQHVLDDDVVDLLGRFYEEQGWLYGHIFPEKAKLILDPREEP